MTVARVMMLAVFCTVVPACALVISHNAVTGKDASLTPEGFQSMISLNSNYEMQIFARRLLEKDNYVATDDTEFSNFLNWYSKKPFHSVPDSATFTTFIAEISRQPWVESIDSFLQHEDKVEFPVGRYRIVYDGVPINAEPSRNSESVGFLKNGTEIHVLKIGDIVQLRQRAFINKPRKGWVSLRQMELGTQYALPIVDEKSCQNYCEMHAQPWHHKCQWNTNDCSGCGECVQADERSVIAPMIFDGAVTAKDNVLMSNTQPTSMPPALHPLLGTDTQHKDFTAPLTEEGYQQIAAIKSDDAMSEFALHLLDSKNLICENMNDLDGFVPWFSGVKAVQSFQAMVNQITIQPWVKPSPPSQELIGAPIQALQTATVDASAAEAETQSAAERSAPARVHGAVNLARGLHRITYAGGVPVSQGLGRRSPTVATLNLGDEVMVLEIGPVVENRQRVLIAKPPGWISLSQVELGINFAEAVVQNCRPYCSKHKLQWHAKCQWDTNHCSACDECQAGPAASMIM